MTLKKAIDLLVEKFPGYIPVGYWVKGDVYVINTKPIKVFRDRTAPSQFVVTQNGEVYGTNPMIYDLSVKDMIKI